MFSTRRILDHTARGSVQIGVNVNVSWGNTQWAHSEETNTQLQYHQSRWSFCHTWSQITFDYHLILLLVSSGDDQKILGADKPQKLLKPANKCVESEEERALACTMLRGRTVTSPLPINLPGFLNAGDGLHFFKRLFGLFLSWFEGLHVETNTQRSVKQKALAFQA